MELVRLSDPGPSSVEEGYISLLFAGSPLPPSAGEAGKVSMGREDQVGHEELLGFAIKQLTARI